MRAHSLSLPALLAACALAASLGCAQPVITIGVTVVTSACPLALSADPQRDPMSGVDTLRFTLTGDGLSAMTQTSPYTAGSGGGANISNIPLGTNRRLVAEALASGTGLVRARADSGPFDVTSSGDVQLTLFLRVIDAFVFTGSQDGTACTHLNTPRAGHQMTQLADGRVLITGGYNIDASGSLNYLTQAELYDPRDGSFAIVGGAANFGRAGHAAFPVLVDGIQQVLLLGGEGPVGGTIGPVGPFELYSGGAFSTLAAPAIPRERAAMALDVKTGYAVMAGGANGPDVPGGSVTIYDAITYFNPQQDSIVEVDEPLAQPLADSVAVSRQNTATGVAQGGVVVLGGVVQSNDSTAASDQISGIFFQPADHAYVADTKFENAALAHLPTPRVHHAALVAPDDTVFVLGGSTTANDTYADTTDAITVVAPDQATVSNATEVLSQGRADGCAVLLASGDLLYAGGAWGDSSGVQSVGSVDLITPMGQASTVRALEGPTMGGNWGLQAARHKAACLQLADGTVLVTGGLQFNNGSPITLGSAEIYTPPGQ